MKKSIIFSLVLLLAAPLFAQTPEDLDRDRSKYATYNFSKDDQYTVETPYETVTVKQPKSKKVKNVIFLIGDGTGLSQWSVGWVANGGKLAKADAQHRLLEIPDYAVQIVGPEVLHCGTGFTDTGKYHFVGSSEFFFIVGQKCFYAESSQRIYDRVYVSGIVFDYCYVHRVSVSVFQPRSY